MHSGTREAEGPLDLAAPGRLDAPLILPSKDRGRAAVRLPAAQMDVRDGLDAPSRRRLEPGQIDALRARELAQERVACCFLEPCLDGPRLQGRQPVREMSSNLDVLGEAA